MNNYGTKLQIVKNTGVIYNSLVTRGGDKRIVVTPVSVGSEKQIEYATSLKLEAMRTIDDTMLNIAQHPGAIVDKVRTMRNSLLEALDAEIDARIIIDNLKGISRYADAIAKLYLK